MKQLHRAGYCFLVASLMLIALAACEHETYVTGKVTNEKTGAPVIGAHLMEVAVFNKTAEILYESYTDSLGSYEMGSGGLTSFGLRKVNLEIIVEKDSYATKIVDFNDIVLDIQLRKY